MAISFVGFIGATTADLAFKIIVDAIALIWLIRLSQSRRRVAAK
jgi:hypothetical protein